MARQQEANVEVCKYACVGGGVTACWTEQLIEMMEDCFSFLLLWIESNLIPPPHPMPKLRFQIIDFPHCELLCYLILQTVRQNSKEKT